MNKLFTKIAALFLGMTMAVGVGVAVGSGSKASEVRAAEQTVSWSASTGSLGNQISSLNGTKTGNISTGSFSWDYTRKLVALKSGKSDYVAMNNGYMQMGSSNAGESLVLNTSNIPGTIKSISVLCGSTGSVHSLSITVGGNSYFSGSTPAWNGTLKTGDTVEVSNKTSSGEIVINFGNTSNTAPLFLKTLSITYEESTPVQNHTVSFNMKGHGTKPADQQVADGGYATEPTAPTAEGYDFGGWYKDSDCTDDWDFATDTVTSDVELFAKWTEVIPTGMTIASSVSTLTPSGDNYIVNLVKGAKTGETDNVYDDDLLATVTPTNALDKTLTWTKTDPSSLIGTWFPGGSELMFDFSTENKGSFVITATTTKGNVVRTVTYNIADKFDISTEITGGSVSGDAFILEGGNASVTITPDGTHKMPSESDITVTGATSSYSDGVITLSNPTGNVTISINCPALTPYSITVDASNATVVGDETILESKTATILFEPYIGYGQPNDVAVDGATKDWDKANGTLTLSNPTKNVTVTYVAAENELSSITLNPASRDYVLGEDFVMPEVTANYTVAASKVVSGATKQPTEFDPFTLGSQVFTISYTEGGITKTAEYTATVKAKQLPTTSNWVATPITSLTSDDVFVIVGDNGDTYALPNDGGATTPDAVEVEVSNGKIVSEVDDSLKWNIESSSNGYIFYPDGTTESWLYCNGSNSGVRIGNDANKKMFTIDQGYLKNSSCSRYVGIYNSSDWRCYTSINSNIQGQTFAFYKEVKVPVGTGDLIRITADYTAETKAIGDTVYPTDFLVKKQLNTSEALVTIENSTGVTITSGATLSGESNDVTLSYTENNITKTTTISVPAVSTPTIELDKLSFAGSSNDGVTYSLTATVKNLTTPVYHWSITGTDTDAIDLTSSQNSGTATFTMVKGGSCSISIYASENGNPSKHTETLSATVTVTQSGVEGVTIAEGEEGYVYEGNTYQLHASLVNPTGAAVGTGFTWSTSDNEIATVTDSGLITGAAHGAATITATSVFDTSKKAEFKINVVGQINDIIHTETITPAWDETINAYVKITSTSQFVSGEKYLIVYEGDENHGAIAFNGHLSSIDVGQNGIATTIDDGKIAIPTDDNYYFTISVSNNRYTITSQSGLNIGHSEAKNGMNLTGDNALSFDESGNVVIQGTGGSYLRYNYTSGTSNERFRYYGNGQQSIALYKYTNEVIHHPAVTDDVEYANVEGMEKAQLAVIAYAQTINTEMNKTDVCSGDHSKMSDAWGEVKAMYEALFVYNTVYNLLPTELAHAKNMLKYVQGNWSSANFPTLVEHAMKTYDVCVKTYDMENFMMDGEDPLRTPVQDVNPISIFGSTENGNMVAIVVIVSVVSLTAIGGYFFLRKRREQE